MVALGIARIPSHDGSVQPRGETRRHWAVLGTDYQKKEGEKMKGNIWVLCTCPECDGEFIAKLQTLDDKGTPDNTQKPNNLFNLKPLPETLTCPYCGVKNDVYAVAFPQVTV